MDCAPLDHLYIDVGSHFIQLFGGFAGLAGKLIFATDDLEFRADVGRGLIQSLLQASFDLLLLRQALLQRANCHSLG